MYLKHIHILFANTFNTDQAVDHIDKPYHVLKPVLLLLCLLVFLPFTLQAQLDNVIITKLEYFIDNDPGVGKATPVTNFTHNSDILARIENISAAHLTEGIHRMVVRAQGSDGQWSISQIHTFYRVKVRIPPNIKILEYFVDDDPGVGKAKRKNVISGANVNETLNIALDASGSGLHTLYIRTMDDTGRWSLTQSTTFQQFQIDTTPGITAVEWFVDRDLGFGKNNMETIFLQKSGIVPFMANISGLQPGMHTLYVRTRNALMQWSLTHSITFVKADMSSLADITQLEYFVDQDPGIGKGNKAPVGTPGKNVTTHFTINDSFDEGIHTLYIRARNSNGQWSTTQLMDFYQMAPQNIPDVDYLEYFIDDDPGFGKAHSIVNITSSGNLIQPFTVNLSGVGPGMHRLYIRARNTAGKWSITQSGTFVKTVASANEPVTALEWFLDEDPGIGQTGYLVQVSPSETVKVFNVDFGTLERGLHTLYVRARNAKGQWGITQSELVFRMIAPDAPNIIRLEYFITKAGDPPVEPGFGKAIPYSAFTPAPLVESTFHVNLPQDAEDGWYTLSVRAMDSRLQWSITQQQGFVVTKEAKNSGAIALEYFVDKDPGFGKANRVTLASANGLTIVNIGSGEYSEGLHTVYMRALNARGVWGITQHLATFYSTDVRQISNIDALEYFIDTDPGFGKATAVAIPSPGTQTTLNQSFNVPLNDMAAGLHTIYVRARSVTGVWSLTHNLNFQVINIVPETLSILKTLEYFVDTDPGFGAGTQVSLSGLSDSQGFAVALDGLSAGFHTLYVRSQNVSGKWSITQSIPILINSIAENHIIPDAVKLEWFIDKDPGIGLANKVPLTSPGQDAQQSFIVSLTNVTSGMHSLYVRTANAQGQWSITQRLDFVMSDIPVDYQLAELAKLEYFIDTDPGFGKSPNFVQISQTATSTAFTINLDNVDDGVHTLYVRAIDKKGNWTLTQNMSFFRTDQKVELDKEIVYLEWFMDNDPGFGEGTPITINRPNEDIDVAIFIPLDNVWSGVHELYFRARDAHGDWSVTQNISLMVVENPRSGGYPDIVALEYFFDADPGFGKATPYEINPTSVNINERFFVVIDTIPEGLHTLYIRGRNSLNEWSITQDISIYNSGIPQFPEMRSIIAFEYFVDKDPGVGKGVRVEAYSPEQSVQQRMTVNVDTLSAGFHYIFVRALDNNNGWSHTQSFRFIRVHVIPPAPVTAIEYFIDKDPGFGKGKHLSVSQGTDIDRYFNVALADTLPAGPHTLYLRSRSLDGDWSLTQNLEFAVVQLRKEYGLSALEYFIDDDPGVGLAHAMPVPYGEMDANVTMLVPLTNIGAGLHTLYVRGRNTEGSWGVAQNMEFAVVQAVSESKIMELEYFVDVDPGVGKALKVADIVPGATVNKSFVVDLSAFEPGLHTLYVRARDENDNWSITQDIEFIRLEKMVLANIVKAEYFIDNSVEYGKGINIPIGQTGTSIQQTVQVNVSGLADGLHTIFVRVLDDQGYWSITQNQVFVKQSQHIDASTMALEWFIDTDPGFGAGTAHPVNAVSKTVNIPINTSHLSAGIHTLYIRGRNSNGNWSITQDLTFVLLEKIAQPKITAIQYYIDTDPGFGGAVEVDVTPATQISKTIQVDVASLPEGLHHMFVRVKDELGQWSITQVHPFIKAKQPKQANVTALEWFIDTDPGFGAGNHATPGANVSIGIGTVEPGLHTLYFRAKTADGQWSITQDITFLKMETVVNPKIVAIEYFLDSDPGAGKSPNRVEVVPSAQIAHPVTVDVSGLPEGLHTMYVRVMDDSNSWSITQSYTFLKIVKSAADIAAFEYFIDQDPGFGKSPNYQTVPKSGSLNRTVTVNTSSLADGIHTVFVRVMDEKGAWSMTQHNTFLKVRQPELPDVVALEWFIDRDPGFGKANTAAVNGTNIPINVSSLASGMHTLYMRAKTSNGQWSVTQNIPFVKVDAATTVPNLTALEWFIDKDPGFGLSPHQIALSGNAAAQSFIVDMSALEPDESKIEGFHNLYIRAKDDQGHWSITHDIRFYTYIDTSETADIVALEWFIDTDPGFGQAPALQSTTFAPGQRNVIHTFTVNTNGLDMGMHTLYVRAKSMKTVKNEANEDVAEYQWSITQYEPFAVVSSRNVVAVEYFVDQDLGFGKNTVTPVTSSDHVVLPLHVATSSLGDGMHTFYVRARNEAGAWGITQRFDFVKLSLDEMNVPEIARIEYFIDNDLGFGKGQIINIGSGTNVTKSFTSAITGIQPGVHTFYVRAQDKRGHWGQTQYSQFVKVEQPVLQNTVALEWFIDEDPGFGKAVRIPVAAGTSAGANINITNTTAGMHHLYVRALDAENHWSQTQSIEFLTVEIEKTDDVTAVEYFFDTDPGFGAATPVPGGITAGLNVTKTFNITTPPNITPGMHTFYTRARNRSGKWSQTQYSHFFKYEDPAIANVISIEWFIDEDPGFGKANKITVSPSATGVSKTFSINAAGIPQGLHTLYVRVLNEEGRWGITQYNQFIKVEKPVIPNTVALEWFIDNDPGFGKATRLPVPAGTSTGASIDVGNTSPGQHSLYVRALDASDQWSLTHSIDFMTIDIEQAKVSEVVAAEWFFDNDPGFGNANVIGAFPAGFDVTKKFNIQISANMAAGIHTLYIRARNADGRWSVTQYNQFLKVDKYVTTNAIALEYFIDKDPGFGKATKRSLVPGANASDAFNVAIDMLDDGMHTLYIRAQNAQKRWGITHSIEFLKVQLVSAPPNIVAMEYFIDEDPGFGKATTVPNIMAANMVTKTFAVSLNGVGTGSHTLYIRALDSNGKWSITQFESFIKTSVRILPDMIAAEYFLDTDPGFGEGTRLTINPSSTEYTLSFMLTTNQLTIGAHTLYVRTLDEEGQWSITQDFDLLVLDMKLNEISKVAALEYFFDHDPGFGKGQIINVTPAEMVERKFFVSVTDLSEGIHTLYVRAINEDQTWSITQYGTFVKIKVLKRSPDIVRIEYFFDTDPGFGKGKPITTTPDANINKVFQVDLSDLVTEENKKDADFSKSATLFIRALDTEGKWAITHTFDINITNRPPEDTGDWPVGGYITPSYTEACQGRVPTIALRVVDYAKRVGTWESRIIHEDGSATPWTTVGSSTGRTMISVDPKIAGTWQYRATIYDGDRGPEYSAHAEVNIIPAAVGGTITGTVPEYVCSGKDFRLTLENYKGTIVKWQQSIKGSNTWTDIPKTDATVTITPEEGGIWQYRAEVAMGECSNDFSGIFEVNVISSTTGGEVTPATLNACMGKNFELTAKNYLGKIVNWQRSTDNGLHWTDIPFSADIYNDTRSELGTVQYRVAVKAGNCDITYSEPAIITVLDKIDAAKEIVGPDIVCAPDDRVRYSVPTIANVDYYEWTLPAGASFASESNRNEVLVAYSSTALSGFIKVKGVSNMCGAGAESVKPIEVRSKPDTPVISGSTSVSVGQNVTYTATDIPGATYTWTIPTGWVKISPDDNSRTITVVPTTTMPGTIRVTATVNTCISEVGKLDVTVSTSCIINTGPIYRLPNN